MPPIASRCRSAMRDACAAHESDRVAHHGVKVDQSLRAARRRSGARNKVKRLFASRGARSASLNNQLFKFFL
jgi:hypothetical protein